MPVGHSLKRKYKTMEIEIKVPSPGESITEVQLVNWIAKDGAYVEKDSDIAEIDSDKATLTVSAEESGVLKILVQAGETVKVGSVIGKIDASVKATVQKEENAVAEKPAELKAEPVMEIPAEKNEKVHVTPLARQIMKEKNLSENDVLGKLKITKQDVLNAEKAVSVETFAKKKEITRNIERKKMSTLRLKLAERLVAVKNQTAMLTTFNEVDMSAILALKKQYNESFKEKYGVGIGFMSFFTKAVTIALEQFPQVNAMIDGDELVFHNYADIGIAVSAPKGLVVPVIRNAEALSLAQIEIKIKELAGKARENKITLDEMTGGTFSITNGGVFGSMMSTPILNPPQSAILGMHNIIERPIARNGQVVIAPMMYIALSYDHRVIDGRESVSFLVKVKELLENPVKMLFEGADPNTQLLGI